MHGATFTSSKPRRVHHRPKKCAPFVFELVRAANTVYKKLKSITEFIWLFYPKATFPTLSASGELQASRLPRHPWFKIPRQNLTSKNILKCHTNRNVLSFIANEDSPPGYQFCPLSRPLDTKRMCSSNSKKQSNFPSSLSIIMCH